MVDLIACTVPQVGYPTARWSKRRVQCAATVAFKKLTAFLKMWGNEKQKGISTLQNTGLWYYMDLYGIIVYYSIDILDLSTEKLDGDVDLRWIYSCLEHRCYGAHVVTAMDIAKWAGWLLCDGRMAKVHNECLSLSRSLSPEYRGPDIEGRWWFWPTSYPWYNHKITTPQNYIDIGYIYPVPSSIWWSLNTSWTNGWWAAVHGSRRSPCQISEGK